MKLGLTLIRILKAVSRSSTCGVGAMEKRVEMLSLTGSVVLRRYN